MIGALAAKRARLRSTKRYLASIGQRVDRKTLRKMTRAANRRVPWYIHLGVVLPGIAFLVVWIWLFRQARFAGGGAWSTTVLVALLIFLPTLVVVMAIRSVLDRLRHGALLHALREDFHIAVCTECGYDLRGSGGMAAKRCPECGTTFEARPDHS